MSPSNRKKRFSSPASADPARAFGSEEQTMEEIRRQNFVPPPPRQPSALERAESLRERLRQLRANAPETPPRPEAPVYSAETYAQEAAPDLGWESAFAPQSAQAPKTPTAGERFEAFRQTVYSVPNYNSAQYSGYNDYPPYGGPGGYGEAYAAPYGYAPQGGAQPYEAYGPDPYGAYAPAYDPYVPQGQPYPPYPPQSAGYVPPQADYPTWDDTYAPPSYAAPGYGPAYGAENAYVPPEAFAPAGQEPFAPPENAYPPESGYAAPPDAWPAGEEPLPPERGFDSAYPVEEPSADAAGHPARSYAPAARGVGRPSDLHYYFWSGSIVAGCLLTLFSFIYACVM